MNFLLIFVAVVACTKASRWANITATIAVVEYRPILNTTLSNDERILANTEQYIKLLESVDDTLDMIIFPEDTLRNNPKTAVELKLRDNPCDLEDIYPIFIRDLSCAARNATSYLVVNLVQKVKCERANESRNCKNFGHFFYNTDVVFDKDGTIVSLYHKYNLFGERELDLPPAPEEVVVEADFGINFGIFTCFDILFKTPAQDLLAKNVDAVIFPSMWFSQLPFLTSLQTQDMWAHAHNIKLFASGANNPPVGSGGTGVYDGAKGAILTDIIAKGGSKAYVYKHVGGKPPQPLPDPDTDALAKDMDSFDLSIDPSVKNYNSTLLDTSKEDFTAEVCYHSEKNQICCKFATKITTTGSNSEKNSYVYHLVAFSGVRPFNALRKGGIEICAVIACLNSSLSSCGQRFDDYDDIEWPIKFEEITIKANFEKSENKTQYPNSLLSSIRPIQASQTVWEEKEVDGKNFVERTFALKESQDRILTFAIFGRNFVQDSPPPTDDDNGSSRSMCISWILAIFVVILSTIASK